ASEIELPEIKRLSLISESVFITRTFNVTNMTVILSISYPNSKVEIFDDEPDKIKFINDYIISIDAAKFVFFDAEKISEIDNLSIKEEGSFINDALGKILGLDIYDALIEDIEYYINTKKKEGATKNLQEQIVDKEKAVELSEIDIEKLEEENAEKL